MHQTTNGKVVIQSLQNQYNGYNCTLYFINSLLLITISDCINGHNLGKIFGKNNLPE